MTNINSNIPNTSSPPIAALSTPIGKGALAVIRLTGVGVHELFAEVIYEKERFREAAARRIGVYTVIDSAGKCPVVGAIDNFVVGSSGEPSVGDGPRANTVAAGDGSCTGAVAAGSSVYASAIGTIPDTRVAGSCGRDGSDVARSGGVFRDGACGANGREAIDEVTAVKYAAPRSYTGEEMVELFCHGGAVIPRLVLERLFAQGARAAGRGEFSRRAFLNGKMGILRAEGVRELIESQTETRLRSARLAYFGKQSESIEKLRRGIVDALGAVESGIEFGEEDDVAESRALLASENKNGLSAIVARLEEEMRRGERVKALDDGVTIALAGPPNAGKSSLFNEILGYDRAIVHDRPGTTRDIVSERISFDGNEIKLFDSAGIRETEDAVERFGIERTRDAVRDAHVVFWVTAADEALGEEEKRDILDAAGIAESSRIDALSPANPTTSVRPQGVDTAPPNCGPQTSEFPSPHRLLVVINKIDTNVNPSTIHTTSTLTEKRHFCEINHLNYVETSLTQKINRERLFDAIGSAARHVLDDAPVPEIIVNERHRGIVEQVARDVREAIGSLDVGRDEIAAHFLKSALEKLSEFSGFVSSDDVLDGIFDRFCIGK